MVRIAWRIPPPSPLYHLMHAKAAWATAILRTSPTRTGRRSNVDSAPGTSANNSQQQCHSITSDNSQPAQSSNATLLSGLVLSPAVEPFRRKVVQNVCSGQFVEMCELLGDKIALVQQLEAVQGYPTLLAAGPSRSRPREVTSLSTWSYCFLGYMAILTSDPTHKDQLAYARLGIREALRHWGTGWLDYDRAFHQQAVADTSLHWNTLLPGLELSTILGQRNRQDVIFCTLCHGIDHTRPQCALAYMHPPPIRNLPASYPLGMRCRQDNICFRGTKAHARTRECASIATFAPSARARNCRRNLENPVFKPQRPRPQGPPQGPPVTSHQ